MGASTTAKRLLREMRELSASSSNPNPSFHAEPVSDMDLFEWHFTLLGPPSPSPYAGGLYHGRISLPLTYPLKPPNFRFLNPSGRFEVNRSICLSISGFHEESWMPAWGLRTALVALRTFMGEEGTAGQVGGMEASREVRQQMAQSSRHWRCEACGGRTNEEVMKDWWAVCREKGVQVEQEAGLEEVPDGLKLGFQDQLGKGEKRTAINTETRPVRIDGPPPRLSALLPGDHESAGRSDRSSKPSTEPSAQPSGSSLEAPASPAYDDDRKLAEHSKPNTHPSPSAIRPITTPEASSATTPLLDKAISGLVLALLFMFLKKVLYNPNVMESDDS